MRLHVIVGLLAVVVSGCGSVGLRQPSAAELAGHERERRVWYAKRTAELEAEQEAEQSVWRLACTDDFHGTAERRCSAENGKGFKVMFVGGAGPYVQAGPYWHVDKPSVVRVDSGTVHITGERKQLLPADAVVKDLLRGQMAYATCYNWPYDTPHHTENDLRGFKEAYAQLLQLKAKKK